MRSNYKRLGEYIKLADKRNRNLEIDNLIGLSIQKKFISSISNTIGTDMSTYRILNRDQFAYCSVTSRNGEKITIALYQENKTAMVSQAYDVFEIIDKKELLPEYLMMWFRRPEFDRFARFKSHGSVREMFEWEDMCNVTLPIPHIDKQKEIVKEYNVIINRINLNNQLNQKLEETAQAIYKQWFVDFEFPDENGNPYKSNGGEMVESELGDIPINWRIGLLKDVLNFSNKKISINELSLSNYISTENMIQNRGGISSAINLPDASSVTKFEIGEVLISNIRPYFKKIWLSSFEGGCSNDVLCFVPKNNIPSLYIYHILEMEIFFDYVMAGSKGTKMPRGDKKWIMNYPIVIPDNSMLKHFNITVKPISKIVREYKKENELLKVTSELILSKLATT